MSDEPLLEPAFPGDSAEEGKHAHADLAQRIAELVRTQPYAVLCTQGRQQPYGSLVAVAVAEDLTAAVFATSIATRKYRLLSECDHVALVIDSRARSSEDMMAIEAVTATGRAHEMEAGRELERWAALLISRHRQLETFIRAPTSAIFRVDIIRYFHVTRFQDVRQWIPTRG